MLFARVYLPLALGYFISYFFRNANAIIEQDLVRELGLSASSLGLLTSAYFISFAAFQLPLGLLLDRYGTRRTESTLLVFAALGAVVFSSADSLAGLIIGRLFIGLGVSACLMGAFKAYVVWFPSTRLPLINGLQMVAGGLGALSATTPLQFALGHTDWRGIFVILGIVTLAAATFLFMVHPEKPQTPQESGTLREQLEGLRSVFQSRALWQIAPFTVLTQAVQLAVLGLWAKPWLRDVAGLEPEASANVLFWMMVAMMAGFLTLGALTEQISKSGLGKPMTVGVAAMIAFMAIQLPIVLAWTAAPLMLMALYSFFSTSGILIYSGLPQQFPKHLAGRVITLLNVMVFSGAFVIQWGIGVIIDLWPGTTSGNYSPLGYQAAFGALLVLQGLGLVWYLLSARFLPTNRPK